MRRPTPGQRLLGFTDAERRLFANQLHGWKVRHHWTGAVPPEVQHRLLDALREPTPGPVRLPGDHTP